MFGYVLACLEPSGLDPVSDGFMSAILITAVCALIILFVYRSAALIRQMVRDHQRKRIAKREEDDASNPDISANISMSEIKTFSPKAGLDDQWSNAGGSTPDPIDLLETSPTDDHSQPAKPIAEPEKKIEKPVEITPKPADVIAEPAEIAKPAEVIPEPAEVRVDPPELSNPPKEQEV